MGGYARCKNGHVFYYPYHRGTTWRDYTCTICGAEAIGTEKQIDHERRTNSDISEIIENRKRIHRTIQEINEKQTRKEETDR